MKKYSVTVAISAYNEQKNIVNFLKSILSQKEVGFVIKEIWVHSDGSTDNTVKLIKDLKIKKLKVWDHKKRIGKSSRLNQIYQDLKSNFLVQSDADVVFGHDLVIHNLIQPLIKNERSSTTYKKVGMSGGNPQPKKSVTFIESAINSTFKAYAKFREEVRGGDNIFSADGRLLSFKKELVKKITIPETMIANDAYAYFCCLTLGYKYKYVSTAVVFFRSPQNMRDHLRQNIRFEAAPIRMTKYFSEKLVKKEKDIPLNILLKHFLNQFFKKPIHCIFIFVINLYCRYKARINETSLNAKWLLAESTKKI